MMAFPNEATLLRHFRTVHFVRLDATFLSKQMKRASRKTTVKAHSNKKKKTLSSFPMHYICRDVYTSLIHVVSQFTTITICIVVVDFAGFSPMSNTVMSDASGCSKWWVAEDGRWGRQCCPRGIYAKKIWSVNIRRYKFDGLQATEDITENHI